MAKQLWKPGNMLYPLPVVMVSVADKEGRNNIITIAWAGTICSNPPMVSISVRPERYSYDILKETGEFVINLTTKDLTYATDYCGVKSGRDVDKFADCTPNRSENGLVVLPRYINAWLPLEVERYVDLGTHGMFICRVTEEKVVADTESMTYAYYHKNVKPKPETEKKGFVCKICGWVYEGEELPEDIVCPLCKHGAADFEPLA